MITIKNKVLKSKRRLNLARRRQEHRADVGLNGEQGARSRWRG